MKRICIYFLLFLFCSLFSFDVNAQDIIRLKNSSFEGFPRHSHTPEGWYDCGSVDESPPDVHPQAGGGQFSVSQSPVNGRTYLGMVVRDNNTWEAIGQQLNRPLEADQCYDFSLFLSRSLLYKSLSRATNEEANYAAPCIVRIWGGNEYCDRVQLLGETKEIINTEWQEYVFSLMPLKDISYLVIEVYYATPVLEPYNGNVLIDNASIITPRVCTKNDTLLQEKNKDVKPVIAYNSPNNNVDVIDQIARKNVDIVKKTSIVLRLNPKQSVSSIVTELQKKFDELNIVDDLQLLISILVASKEDRAACKKLLKEAMKTLKGTYKSYSSQVIVSK